MELTLDKIAKEVAEKALDEITYEGKTIREWVEIIVKQDCISREDALEEACEFVEIGYNGKGIFRRLKELPSVTSKTSCESCREQVLKHPEKEDWADTVNCVMNMPFMKGEETGVLDKIRSEIMQLDFDLDTVDYDYNDMTKTEEIHTICREEVLQIIDKYKEGEK